MHLPGKMIAAVLCLSLGLSPVLAEAKAGQGTSSGSKGSKSSQPAPGASQPIQRSLTPPTGSTAPSVTPTPKASPQAPVSGGATLPPPSVTPSPAAPKPMGAPPVATPPVPAAPVAQPSFFQRHPILTGIAGGFLGASVANMLFGGKEVQAAGAPAPGEAAPGASLFGSVLKWALILGLLYLAFSLFRRLFGRSPQPAGNRPFAEPTMRHAEPVAGDRGPVMASNLPSGVNTSVTDADYEAWTRILLGVQAGWSAGDLAAMKPHVTPEMLSWFSEDLTRNQSRGIVNRVEDVELLKGDVVESWVEGDLEYASARITFRARDYELASNGAVVGGDRQRAVETTEVWTFVRRQGGQWLLSAIEQV